MNVVMEQNDNTAIILAVDDRPDNLFIIRALVADAFPGCRVLTAQSAKEGLSVAEQTPVDLALIDVQMPGMGGVEMCRRLKADPDLRHIAVALLTAHRAEARVRAEGLDAGADDFIAKPVDNIELVARIRAMLRAKRAEDLLRARQEGLENTVRDTSTALVESESRYKTIFENSRDAILIFRPDGRLVDVNEAACRLTGYPKTALTRMAIPDLYVDGTRDPFRENLSRIMTGEAVTVEATVRRKGGERIEAEFSYNRIYLEGTAFVHSVVRDVSERKRVEKMLRESERRFRNTFENASIGMCLTGINGRFLMVNGALGRMLGFSGDDLVGRGVIEVTHPDDRSESRQVMEDLLEGRQEAVEFEKRFIHKEGGLVWASVGVFLLRGADGRPEHFIAHVQDITRTKELESELRQAHKMEAIGTLAGGVAHDFNNILGIMIGNTELAMDDVPEWNPARLNLAEIKTAGLRAKGVIRQLLSFSRRAEQDRKPVRLQSLVAESARLLRVSIPASVKILVQIPRAPSPVRADATQIHQLLINLCMNAAHAMGDGGGTLTIGLDDFQPDPSAGDGYHGIVEGPLVRLSVSDTGCGMPPETLERIFDPYFTTKEVGTGTGMGLSVVHGIVASHGGTIGVESVPGRGTTVTVLFPATCQVPAVKEKAAATCAGNGESVLLVDDERPLLKMGQRLLERLGYRVETCQDPLEALELFRAGPDRFDLLLTDMTMPNMTGESLAEAVRKIRPKIPVVFCTGYSQRAGHGGERLSVGGQFIEKPFGKKELAGVLYAALGGSGH